MAYKWKTLTILSVSMLSLAACNSNTQRSAENAVDATQNALSNTAEATGTMLENSSLALTPTPSPQKFADKAAKGDAFGIAAAEIAAKNATSPAVKEFAAMMIQAHKTSAAAFKKAAGAAQPAITPDANMTSEQLEDLADLKKLTGVRFDKEYIESQVDAHEDALELIKKYARDGEAATLKAAAAESIPVMERNLNRAREIEKQFDHK